jgi:hypothetical protein
MRTFKNLIDDLGNRLNQDVSEAAILANVKRWINKGYLDFQSQYKWSWRASSARIQIVPIYEDGTIILNQGSRVVAGSGTSWTSTMSGRYFRVAGDDDFYKIISVASPTSLTIDKVFIGNSVSGVNYSIWQRFYSLPQRVSEVEEFFSRLSQRPIRINEFNCPFSEGSPVRYDLAGYDRSVSDYIVGTISGAVDTKTITGFGTLWLDNIEEGDDIIIGTVNYNVLSVDSDTQITLVQNLVVAATAGTSYIARKRERVRIEFDYAPDKKYNITCNFFQRSFDMINDNDEPEIPEKYRDVIILAAIPIQYQQMFVKQGQQYEVNAYRIYLDRVRQIIAEQENESEGGWKW